MESGVISKRLQAIEERLARLETALNLPVAHSANRPITETAAETKSVERHGNWLGMIAVICFILAAGFIIKLAIDSGWLTPVRQIGLALCFGGVLIGSGFLLLSSDKPYASLLPAAGVIVLYLTVFAAHRLYFLITFHAGLGFTSLVSGVCIWLYLRLRHDIFSIIVALGAYLAPITLDLRDDTLFSLYYFLICSCTFATLSIWVKSRSLTAIAAYLAILITGLIGFNLQQDEFIAVVLALHFLVFAIGTYFYSQQNKQPMTEKEAWSLFPVLVIFYAMEYFYINRALPGLAPWFSIAFAMILMGLYLSARKWFAEQLVSSQSLIMAFSTLVFFHSVYLELLPDNLKPWLFSFFVISLAVLPSSTWTGRKRLPYLVPGLAVIIILAIEYINILLHLFGDSDPYWAIVAAVSFGSLWGMLLRQRNTLKGKEDYGWILLAAAHILGLSACYQLVDSSLAVSALWLFYAMVVIGFGYYRKDRLITRSALLILAAAAAKALLYDAASTPTVVRILCLLLTGMVLYGCGFLLRKTAQWPE
ncbi:DUF2339 domain-containing protein [Legionella dresdenensis]|uniref:DUF2339 domain-containing protein n=1 Tax=Legionella dresdenensis TaxID=450200 RepID=A0ABV8CGV1_9GAMM